MKTSARFLSFLGIVAIILYITPSDGHPTGAPSSQCDSMTPGHQALQAQTSEPPYQVVAAKNLVQGGELVRIRLAATSIPYKGFLAMATKVADGGVTDGPALLGKIKSLDGDRLVQKVKCFGLEDSALTHTDNSAKRSIEFDWIAPNEDGHFVILATFVKDFKTFWVHVPSQQIQVKKNPNFFPDDEEHEGNPGQEGNPAAFDKVEWEIRTKYYEGCGKTKGCFGIPDNCFQNKLGTCDMFTSWRYEKGDFKFQIAGKLPDWENYEDTTKLKEGHISSGLSHDAEMGSDSVIGCVYKDGNVKPKSYYNLPGKVKQNSIFKNESTGLGKGASGKYEHGYLMCDFTRTILLPDTTKEIGASFDLIKNKFHIIMARASSLTKNAENGREKLGYHASPEDRGVSYRPIQLTEGYSQTQDNRGPDGGDGGYYPDSGASTPKSTTTTKQPAKGAKRSNAKRVLIGQGIHTVLVFVIGLNVLG